EQRMWLHLHHDEEIAGVAAVAANVSLARNPDPRAVGETRQNLDRQRLGADFDLSTAACPAVYLPLPSGTAALRARLREHHVAARRFDDARAVAMLAAHLRDVQAAEAAARVAVLLSGDGDRSLAAARRFFKAERDGLMKIGAALRAFLPPLFALMKDIGKEIAERRCVGAADARREVEAFEPVRAIDSQVSGRPGGVVAAPPIRVAQRFVRFDDLPELRRRSPIARVDVGMVFTRKPLVRPLHVDERRVPIEPEYNVEVHYPITRLPDYPITRLPDYSITRLLDYPITVSPRPRPPRRSHRRSPVPNCPRHPPSRLRP